LSALAICLRSLTFRGVDDCKKMVEALEEAGVDLIELSGGSYQSLAFEHVRPASC